MAVNGDAKGLTRYRHGRNKPEKVTEKIQYTSGIRQYKICECVFLLFVDSLYLLHIILCTLRPPGVCSVKPRTFPPHLLLSSTPSARSQEAETVEQAGEKQYKKKQNKKIKN